MPAIESLSAFALGSVLFWAVFHRGEHFLFPQRYLQMLLLTILAGTVFIANTASIQFKEAFLASVRLAGIFLCGIYSNCIFYRLFLNPLNSFPGPYLARLTKFDHVFRNINFDAHHQLLKQHEKYGDFVRVGPNDLSVTDADGMDVVSNPKSKCTKGPWYAQDTPLTSLHTTRDRAMHDRRRRVWAPAFSDKALRGYEARVQVFNDLLISKLAGSKGMPRPSGHSFCLLCFRKACRCNDPP